MQKLKVKVKALNKRKWVPSTLPDPAGVIGIVNEHFIFQGEKVVVIPNPALGFWYKDRDNNFYWGGGLEVLEEIPVENEADIVEPNQQELEDQVPITPIIKRKIEQVINAFETGTAEGNYATIARHKDYTEPETKKLIVQVTYGRSQTTEFGHLKALIQDYVDSQGALANELKPFLNRIGKKPSLATDDVFCNALKQAGKNDAIMKACQDRLFESKYYQPAYSWFEKNGFTLPLSMLVIYDSRIHSGSILPFLRRRFKTVVPASGGNEKEWITNYINVRHHWLANHSNSILQKTIYRTECFQEQVQYDNWDLSQTINAHGVKIN